MRVDRCDFSGFRVYPAKGRTYVRGDSKVCFCALLAVNQSIVECKPHEEPEGDGDVIKGIGRISGCDRGSGGGIAARSADSRDVRWRRTRVGVMCGD